MKPFSIEEWAETLSESNRKDLIKIIEKRTWYDVIGILKKAGLGKDKKYKLRDYSCAKKACFQGLFINSDIYDKQIGWIIKYLKI